MRWGNRLEAAERDSKADEGSAGTRVGASSIRGAHVLLAISERSAPHDPECFAVEVEAVVRIVVRTGLIGLRVRSQALPLMSASPKAHAGRAILPTATVARLR